MNKKNSKQIYKAIKVITNLSKLPNERITTLVENIGIAFAEMYKFNQENSGEKDIKKNN